MLSPRLKFCLLVFLEGFSFLFVVVFTIYLFTFPSRCFSTFTSDLSAFVPFIVVTFVIRPCCSSILLLLVKQDKCIVVMENGCRIPPQVAILLPSDMF